MKLASLLTASASLTALALIAAGQLYAQPAQSPTAIEEQLSTPLDNASDPLPAGLIYRQWHLNDRERRSYTDDRYGSNEPVLMPPTRVGEPAESAAKARAVLNRMADFLSKQETASFTLEYELNSQETMSAVATGNNAFESFDFRYAKPNRLRVTDGKSKDDKFDWEIGSDGTYVLRTDYMDTIVEDAAPTLPALLRQEALSLRWAYLVDARGVLSFFDPQALAEWNEGRTLRYCGTREFGSVTADYIVMDLPDDGSAYKRIHLWIAQGESPVPLLLVRDGDRPISTYTRDPADDEEDSLTRRLDTEWRFTDWRFNEPMDPSSFRLTMHRPVGPSFGDLESGRKTTEMPRFIGSSLPAFSAIDADGNALDREALLNGKHTVLLLWHDRESLLRNWKAAEAAEAMFGPDTVQTVALYIGVGVNQREFPEFAGSILDPERVANAGLKTAPRLYYATQNRRMLQAIRYVTSERCAVIDPSGTIIDTQPGYGGFDFESMGISSIGASLQSRDVVQERRDALARLEVRQDESVRLWNERFETSWDR